MADDVILETRGLTKEFKGFVGAWVTIAQGIIFVICVLTFRRGVVGEIGHFLKKPL